MHIHKLCYMSLDHDVDAELSFDHEYMTARLTREGDTSAPDLTVDEWSYVIEHIQQHDWTAG